MPTQEFRLSPRQIACLRLAAEGKTSAQIAAAIGISPRTVDQYIGDACERMKVRNRVQAVAMAMSHGLLGSSSSIEEG